MLQSAADVSLAVVRGEVLEQVGVGVGVGPQQQQQLDGEWQDSETAENALE